jgi:hypothetical protein
MPPPFRMSVAEFRNLVSTRVWQSQKTQIHVHHTWRPRGADFVGVGTIEAMYNYHINVRKFSDIAQHISIDPEGYIWSGRPWDASPASAEGFNSRQVFMFETIGDFDTGQEPFAGVQKWSVFSLDDSAVKFHNEMSSKSCPGSSISKPRFLRELAQFRAQNAVRASIKSVDGIEDQYGVIDASDLQEFDRDINFDHLDE